MGMAGIHICGIVNDSLVSELRVIQQKYLVPFKELSQAQGLN
jgi:hypothetical protein